MNPPVETTATTSDTVSTSNEETPTGTDTAVELTDKEIILKMLELCSKIEHEEIKNKIIMIFQKSIRALEK